MQRKIVISKGEHYHLYNRGVDKRVIFLDEKDRRRFVKLLYVANGERLYFAISKISRLRRLTEASLLSPLGRTSS